MEGRSEVVVVSRESPMRRRVIGATANGLAPVAVDISPPEEAGKKKSKRQKREKVSFFFVFFVLLVVDHVNVFLFFFSFVLLCFIATVMFGEAERRPSFLSVSCVMLFIYIYGLCVWMWDFP